MQTLMTPKWLGAALVFSAVMGVGGRARAAAPLIVAEVAPTTGRFALHAESDRRGVEMAIDAFNAEGGVLGRHIVLVSRNPTLDPAHAATVAEDLITREHVGFMVGAIDSGVAAAMSAVCQRHGVIFINTNSSAPSESVENAHRTKFVFDASAANYNRALFAYALKRPGVAKKVVLLTEDDAFGHSAAQASRDIIEEDGGSVVGEVVVPAALPDPRDAIRRVEASGADVVAVNITGANQIRLFSQIDPAALRRQAWLVGEVDWEELYPAPGTPRPLYAINWSWNLDTPGTAAFVAAYRARWGHTGIDYPGKVTYSAYFATRALLDAVRDAGTTDNHAVIRRLEQLHWSAARRMQADGAWMDPVSHHLQQTIYVATWKPRADHPEQGQVVLAHFSPEEVRYPRESRTHLESFAQTPHFAP